MHQKQPTESFLNKGFRLANQGLNIMGTMKGIYETGKFGYGGLQAARPLLSLL